MNTNVKRVLIIEDNRTAREELSRAFAESQSLQFLVETARDPQQAEGILQKGEFDVITVDLMFGQDAKAGLRLMGRMVLTACPKAVKIVVTAFPSVENCVQAMRFGAWDFIDKEGDYGTRAVCSAVDRLKEIEEARLQEREIFERWLPENEQLLQQQYPGEYVAIREGRVVAHALSMISLGSLLSGEASAEGRMPCILYIGEKKKK